MPPNIAALAGGRASGATARARAIPPRLGPPVSVGVRTHAGLWRRGRLLAGALAVPVLVEQLEDGLADLLDRRLGRAPAEDGRERVAARRLALELERHEPLLAVVGGQL